MQQSFFKYLFGIALLFLLGPAARSQSATTRIGDFDAGGVTEYSQYLYIGPSAHITIPAGQQWLIASQYLFIDPTAVIDGAGEMILDDPGNFGPFSESVAWAGQPTTIDGGNSKILAKVVHRNPNYLILGPVSIAASLGDITTPNTDHTLYIGTSFDFALTHADASALTGNDVLLGNNDFRFAAMATETGYRETRFAVTNGTGHVVKENYTGDWTFPVGIAEGDYTPAAINNTTPNTMHVLVQDYASSAAIEAGVNGMDRTWNIYADAATGTSNIDLQHNGGSGGTNQAAFNNASHFVTRYSNTDPNHTGDGLATSLGPWQSNALGAGTSTGTLTTGTPIIDGSERNRSYADFATSPTDEIAYYSKSSNAQNPLPVQLLSFKGSAKACDAVLTWETANEQHFYAFSIEYSVNATNYREVGLVESKHVATGSAYTLTYAQPTGKGYYRLKMIDENGSFTYSSAVTVATNCHDARGVTLSPNPATSFVSISGLQEGDGVMLYGVNGQLIMASKATSNVATLDLSAQANGSYQVIVTRNADRLQTFKIVKQ